MTFKKSLAFVSAAAVAFSAIAPAATFAASPFISYAEKLAAANVIGSQTSEAGYRLADNITRVEVAKVAALAAGLAAVPSAQSFNDVSSDFAGYVGALVKAGAVNGSAVSFRSSANITRFEALKILTKAIGVSVTETSSNSFSDVPAGEVRNVVEAALAKGLISANVSFRPNDSITRGEFFKIAANAVDLKAAGNNGSDDLGALLGGLFGDTGSGSTSTTSTGTTTGTTSTVTAAGQLQVSLNNASPAGIQIPQTGIVRFAVVDFAAGSSDITVNSVEVKKVGLASVDSNTKVWFEKNGLRLTGKSSFTSDGNVVVSFAPAFVVKAGTVESLDLNVELAGNNQGTDFQFTSGQIVSSAAQLTGSFTTNVLRAANYNVATYDFEGKTTGASYKANNDLIELASFTIAATKTGSITETRDENFQSVTLYQSGAAALTNLSNIVLVRDGNVVSKTASIDGKALTFSVGNLIKDGTTATYYVKANVINVENAVDQYQFRLKNTSDLNIIEAATGFRTTQDTWTTSPINPIAALYTVNGGDVKFDRDSSVALSTNVAPGTTVTLMQGTITAKNAINLEDVIMTGALSGGHTLNEYFTTLYLTIGSSTFSVTATGTTVTFNGSVSINGVAPVKLYGTLRSTQTVPSGSIKFQDLVLSSFITTKEYVANQETVSSSVGSIPGITVTVNSTNLNVTRNDGLGNTNLASGAKGVTVIGTQLSSTKGNPISVSSATFAFAGSGAQFINNAFATLYVNGTPVDSKTIDNTGALKFNLSPNAIVSTTNSVNLVLKADFTDAFTGGTFQASLKAVDATDSVSSKIVTISTVAGATFSVKTAGATLALSDSNPQAKLLLGGSLSNQVFAFKLTANNDAVKIKDLTLTGTKLDQLSNFRLTDVSGNVIATSSLSDSGNVKFESAQSSAVAQDKSAVYYVIADANSNTNTGGIVLNLSGAVVTGTNGADVSVAPASSISSAMHAVADNIGVIAKASNGSKELTTSALRFTVAVDANSKNQLSLSGALVNVQLSGYTGSAIVNVYKTDTSVNNRISSNLDATGTGADQWISFSSATAKNQIDAGSTVTYIVTVEGVIPNANVSGTPSWTVKLNNVDLGAGLNAGSYANLGTFPITEVK